MSELKELTQALINFRDERDWKQFHYAKDLPLAISIESADLNELFLWKKAEEAELEKVKEEIADTVAYTLILADKYRLDLKQTVLK